MGAPPKGNYPVITAATLEKYDAFLFGIPTRYGNMPAQWKTFWDTTGGQWASGAYWGKYAGIFVSTGTPGGGQESTVMSSLSTLTHHGLIYVPLGYKHSFGQLANISEVRGGSPWGAGTFAVSFLSAPSPRLSDLVVLLTQRCNRVLMDLVHHLPWRLRSPPSRARLSVTPSRKSAFDCKNPPVGLLQAVEQQRRR